MTKEDNLCEYIEHLINSIYCGRAFSRCKDCQNSYESLIQGLKQIGFKFILGQPVKFKNLKLWKEMN